jgi:hypothetical protein
VPVGETWTIVGGANRTIPVAFDFSFDDSEAALNGGGVLWAMEDGRRPDRSQPRAKRKLDPGSI